MNRTVQVAASRLRYSIRYRGLWSDPDIGASLRRLDRNEATIGRWLAECEANHRARPKRTG